jgi:hypothetical protein
MHQSSIIAQGETLEVLSNKPYTLQKRKPISFPGMEAPVANISGKNLYLFLLRRYKFIPLILLHKKMFLVDRFCFMDNGSNLNMCYSV